MPRDTHDAASRAEAWLDTITADDLTSPASDATSLRAITTAAETLADAVRTARDDGKSWTQIAVALDVTRAEAHRRYGPGSQ